MFNSGKILKLNPQIIEKDGKEEFVVLPYDEYQAIQALIEDYMDLLELRQSGVVETDQEPTSIDDVIREIEKNS